MKTSIAYRNTLDIRFNITRHLNDINYPKGEVTKFLVGVKFEIPHYIIEHRISESIKRTWLKKKHAKLE